MTTQNTHTPGPWESERAHSGRVIYKEIQRDFETKETRMLAFMVRNGDQFPVEESDANARLIAASPDLLTACESALALLTNPNAEPGDADQVTAMLQTAIDKARGEA